MIQETVRDSSLQLAETIESLTQADIVAYYQRYIANAHAARLVARSAGRPVLQQFQANRHEASETLIFDEGQRDYLPFKARAEHFEFNLSSPKEAAAQ